MRKAILLVDTYLGHNYLNRKVIPAGTELEIEQSYDLTVDVIAWPGESREEVFWVQPGDIEEIT